MELREFFAIGLRSGIGIGAAVMYFYDPNTGRRRRNASEVT